MPEGIQRYARAFHAQPRDARCRATRRVTTSTTRTTRQRHRASGAAADPGLRGARSAIIFCNTRDETDEVAKFLRSRASTPSRSRAICRRTIASACMGRMPGDQVPVRHRRRRARHRHREPVARHQLLVPRVARGLRPPHRPHRPRRQEGHGHLAGRPARARLVLLLEAALQDKARGAGAAVGVGDPGASRGRTHPGAAARAGGRSGKRMARAGAAADRRGRRRTPGGGAARRFVLEAGQHAGASGHQAAAPRPDSVLVVGVVVAPVLVRAAAGTRSRSRSRSAAVR